MRFAELHRLLGVSRVLSETFGEEEAMAWPSTTGQREIWTRHMSCRSSFNLLPSPLCLSGFSLGPGTARSTGDYGSAWEPPFASQFASSGVGASSACFGAGGQSIDAAQSATAERPRE